MSKTREPSKNVEIRVVRAETMTDKERSAVFEVFDASYREPNHVYLQSSIDNIGLLSLAFVDGRPAGYALSSLRWMDLPGFEEPQLVMLGGMRCVIPELRHRGLHSDLTRAISVEMERDIKASGRVAKRRLGCGRWGHASRAVGRDDPGSVPRVGFKPTEWHQQVGLAVAEAFGSNLDPETFVCVGSGTPIGYPNEEFEATEDELAAWAPVDRARGDNLLVINWTPDPPPGWVQT